MVMIIAANAGLELSVPRAVLRAWMSERTPHTEGWVDLLRPGSGREEKTCSRNYRICTGVSYVPGRRGAWNTEVRGLN